MRRLSGTCLVVFAIALGVALLAPVTLFAQSTVKPEALVGKYEGSASGPDGSAITLKVELRLDKGALVGVGDSSEGAFTITGVTITGDKIVMAMDFSGTAGTLSGVVKGERVDGTWVLGEMSGSYTLTKAAAAAPAPAATPEAAAPAKPAANAADPISGQWDGITGQGDQTVGFVLQLKLEGDKVTGSISSDQGGAQVSAGSWKEGALTVAFDFNGMTATMVGAIKEGKLVGTLDIGGQMQMPWAAVKK
ncbi:MAG: hypothetical protein ACM3NQ_18545 [Bacteroidales bacterium]